MPYVMHLLSPVQMHVIAEVVCGPTLKAHHMVPANLPYASSKAHMILT